jgi:hypothetical protein
MTRTNHDEPMAVEVFGRPLHCYACDYDRFWRRSAQLSTALATVFTFDWIDPSATRCICARCGHIHSFLPQQGDANAPDLLLRERADG